MVTKKTSSHTGGRQARENKGPLWQYLPENDGAFLAPEADYISRLYFPLMNEAGMKSSVTPELKGDIAASFPHYLTAATVTEELHRNLSNRNFWICADGHAPWSVSGNSAAQRAEKWAKQAEYSEVEGRPGCFKLRRVSKSRGIEAESCLFVPATDDLVELMLVTVKNTGTETINLSAAAATPVFGRHPDNFRDHRQVTSMFQKVNTLKHGVKVKSTIVHDEKGHSINKTAYYVLGFDADGKAPQDIWASLYDFIGEGGSLDNPEALFKNLKPSANQDARASGRESIGAFRFAKKSLKAGEECRFIVLHGISENEEDHTNWQKKYGTAARCHKQLQSTIDFWRKITAAVSFDTADKDFDNWMRWVAFQLKCRQIFGNSYLPDFGYGRGGRGWRDLWQDLLSIFLIDPASARNEIINNFRGIRFDGSNATIIGNKAGEFIADRNNVARNWCDHGAWPLFVTEFYLNQSGDFEMLLQQLPYWKDRHTHRSKKTDGLWNETQGFSLLDQDGKTVQGSILEHLMVQQLSAFFNVGQHNNLLLEGADWNDTLDMAREKGESVCFHNFYGYNFGALAEILTSLKEKGHETIWLNEEVTLLLDRTGNAGEIDYANPQAKQARLQEFFNICSHKLSGKKVPVSTSALIHDLCEKRNHIRRHIRENEWIQSGEGEGFFNGHYDNNSNAIHGKKGNDLMMDLTSQVMPLMCNTATKEQAEMMHKAVYSHLHDNDSGGLRLCSEFKDIRMDVGRISGFVYGFKEHGSKWMQQNIMFMYGLLKRGMYAEADVLLDEIFQLTHDSATARVFPGIPSFFEPGNHGSYAYLTGSSAWMMLSVVTQLFGVQGFRGALMLKPRLNPRFFKQDNTVTINCYFRSKKLKIKYTNPYAMPPEQVKNIKVQLNGKPLENNTKEKASFLIAPDDFQSICHEGINELEAELT